MSFYDSVLKASALKTQKREYRKVDLRNKKKGPILERIERVRSDQANFEGYNEQCQKSQVFA